MKVKNSLSTFLEQAITSNNNSLEIVDKIGNAMSSSEETVKITITDPSDPNNNIEYTIPSFGHLMAEIKRLSSTLDTVTNVTNGAGSRIRLSDGSYRKIIASKVPSEAPTITHVNNITNFNFKSNWFFEDMLNPSLYITWDMSDQISADTERVMIQRYILTCDTDAKRDVFESLNGRNDIDYKDFLKILVNNNIKYILDDEIKDLPPRSKRYYGTFSVIRSDTEKDINGNTVKRYVLDSMEFTDSRSGFENTRILSVGDYVEVNTNPVTTRFEVVFANPAENKIGLKCIEGGEGVRLGANTLKISSSQDTSVSADIPIGFDEREVIFVKAIDPDSNIPSNRWSPGVAFYSNDLTYMDGNGTSRTLKDFYKRNVVDFGQVLLSYTQDYYPTIREGIKPDAPVLNYANGEGDFKIVQINGQLTETTDSTSFRSLVADKARVQSELDNVNKEISKQKELIQTTNYTSTNEKLKAQATLNTLIDTQETLNSNYASIVNNIKTKYESGHNATPKYRVRGFWDIPNSKISPSSGEQKIIQFKIRYRYLSEAGNANREEEFSYRSGNSTVMGRFSNWNEIETKVRPRVMGADGWEWAKIDTSNPDEVNINQMDIPINMGEQVEIQVKSVSEAGWPSNPMESDWSNAIIVSFADFAELQADNVSELVEQNKVDAAVSNVTKLFKGTAAHMASSFYTNDKYFAHTAETITSGFLSPEQTPITLYDKLQDLQKQITMLIEQINGTIGDICVTLFDNSDESKIYTLSEGGTTYVNAGDYTSAVSGYDEDTKKGAIITKTYYLDISTEAQNGLYLLSKLTGNRLSMCPNTIVDSTNNLVTNSREDGAGNDYSFYDNVLTPSATSSTYYMEQGRYDRVPINLTNPEMVDFQVGSPSMYQSAQCRGQFVYSRFRNIGDTFDMYANTSENGVGKFDYNADFLDSEVYGGDDHNDDNNVYELSADYYGDIDPDNPDAEPVLNMDRVINDYNILTASSLTKDDVPEGGEKLMYKLLNRLPKTWAKPESASDKILSETRVLMRIQNLYTVGDTTSSESGSESESETGGTVEMITETATITPSGTTQISYGNSSGSDISISLNSSKIPSNATNKRFTFTGGNIIVSNVTYNDPMDGLPTNYWSVELGSVEGKNVDGFIGTIYANGSWNNVSGNMYICNSSTTNTLTFSGNSNELPSNIILHCSLSDASKGSNPSSDKLLIQATVKVELSFSVTYDVPKESNVPSQEVQKEKVESAVKRGNSISRRVSTLRTTNTYSYTVTPKIQAAYGYADLGRCLNVDIDGETTTDCGCGCGNCACGIAVDGDDGSFITTHKIGYEEKDRYAIGKETCNSYLFLSPISHSEVQVDGDTANAGRMIKSGESLRVPIIYQYRMEDYKGAIFGDEANKATDLNVKNSKFANIIGIDIWTDRNALRPKQYDIVVYSTYGSVIETNTGRTKTSTQRLIDAGNTIANKLDRLVNDNRSLATKTTIIGGASSTGINGGSYI